MESCQNEELKTQKVFYVEKFSKRNPGFGKPYFNYYFKAVLEVGSEKYLAEMNSQGPRSRLGGGVCDDVHTFEESRGCGLATALTQVCFQDNDVGGVDPKKHPLFNGNVKRELRQFQAVANCAKIVYLRCRPDAMNPPSPTAICSAYLNAAINTGYAMMFTVTKRPADATPHNDVMDVMGIVEAKLEFKKGPDNFIKEHGYGWFFCRCKSNRIDECTSMWRNFD